MISSPAMAADPGFAFTPDDFRCIADLLYRDAGIHLVPAKSALVYSRLARRVRALGMASFRDYGDLVDSQRGGEERGRMLSTLTTNVTQFFREPHHFNVLRTRLLPETLRRAREGGTIRLWSAACSTGQEPYSMAMTVPVLEPRAAELDIRIFGTDIDTEVNRQARDATYADNVVGQIPAGLRKRWLVRFNRLNLLGNWPFKGKVDAQRGDLFRRCYAGGIVAALCRPPASHRQPVDRPLRTHRGSLPGGRWTDELPPAAASVGVRGMSAAWRAILGRRVRTLVVDNSVIMRSLISSVLRRDPHIEVVGHATNALEARKAIKVLPPDVVTLDVEMSGGSGLMLLQKIMQYRPTPVIMVSSLTQSGTEMALHAPELGAVDCVGKPGIGSDTPGYPRLADAVRAAATARIRRVGGALPLEAARAVARVFRRNCIIAIGASTESVEALITVMSGFPANCPPTWITQHMPRNFTRSFAGRLNRSCAAGVAEASEGAPLRSGLICLAPGVTIICRCPEPAACAAGWQQTISSAVTGHRWMGCSVHLPT
jgi:chemotaxis methyl-accepting protein methylase/DNA-binding NarL/FixJ family response regulator